MKKQLSDEQLDALMRTMVNAVAADEATVSEIADSPATWWGVQRQVSEQKIAALSPWPPIGKVLRWLTVGVPIAAAALIISLFIFRPAEVPEHIVSSEAQTSDTVIVKTPLNQPMVEPPSIPTNVVQSSTKSEKRDLVISKPNRFVKNTAARTEVTTAATTKKSDEIKTEFIALSYARDPESGQIVRVKVPSSMMVSLGLVVSVEKPSDLVDAEVLVGDDGLTRAIRFIR